MIVLNLTADQAALLAAALRFAAGGIPADGQAEAAKLLKRLETMEAVDRA